MSEENCLLVLAQGLTMVSSTIGSCLDPIDCVKIFCTDCRIFKRNESDSIFCKSLNSWIRKWGRASLAEISDATSLYTFSLSSSSNLFLWNPVCFDVFQRVSVTYFLGVRTRCSSPDSPSAKLLWQLTVNKRLKSTSRPLKLNRPSDPIWVCALTLSTSGGGACSTGGLTVSTFCLGTLRVQNKIKLLLIFDSSTDF